MRIEIVGVDPPGRRCNPAPEQGPTEDVHVGVGRWTDPVGLVPGDTSTTWAVDVRVVRRPDGIDFRGPQVDGRRGDRFIYLNWLCAGDDKLRLFRRGKVSLNDIDANLVEAAESNGRVLKCTVSLTDQKGNPSCARFRAADLDWRLVSRRPRLNTMLTASGREDP